MRRFRRLGLAAAALVALALVAAAIPVASIEIGCGRGAVPPPPAAPRLDDRGYRRAEGDSYLTYPEWYIVHAYADLAGVARRTSESDYDYAGAITTYWTSLCRATATARAIGPVTVDQRVTDYVIGLSFSLEMAIQGLYERSLGALTAWLRGAAKTPEDAFNQRFLDDYAAFLQQTPWYRYAFGETLTRFWRDTPFTGQAFARSIERRFALTLEYAIKSVYAKAMEALAGYAPADLTIMTIVGGARATDVPGVTVLRDLGDGATLVQTARYEAYTNILRGWAANGTKVTEIAGNHRILTTVLVRAGTLHAIPGTTPIFTIPLQAKPGWERVGLDTEVGALTDVIAAVQRGGATFEHAYDY